MLARIADMSARDDKEMNAGDVYRFVKEQVGGVSYTKFYEIIQKFDAMRLLNLHYRQGRGRTRLISLRYDPGRVLEHLGGQEQSI